jgi:hypothetical protein
VGTCRCAACCRLGGEYAGAHDQGACMTSRCATVVPPVLVGLRVCGCLLPVGVCRVCAMCSVRDQAPCRDAAGQVAGQVAGRVGVGHCAKRMCKKCARGGRSNALFCERAPVE